MCPYKKFYSTQDAPLRDVLKKFYSGDDEALKKYIIAQQSSCTYLRADRDLKSINKYLTVTAEHCKTRIFDAYADSRANHKYPVIKVSYQKDLSPLFSKLFKSKPGSQQDVLYTLTSERAKGWIPSLTALGFHSACMSAAGEADIITAKRLLATDEPDLILEELPGSIPAAFYDNLAMVQSQAPSLKSILQHAVTDNVLTEDCLNPKYEWTVEKINLTIEKMIGSGGLSEAYATVLNDELPNDDAKIVRHWKNQIKRTKTTPGKQEQLVLKFIAEGKLLQKLLDGKIVDHVASNVKMQKNPLRGNKVEVDSIYGVIGGDTRELVLVEAKDKPSVAITQLFTLYQTYRLRLPPDWRLTVVAALLNYTDEHIEIDMMDVTFDDATIMEASSCINSAKIEKHYKWRISRINS